MSLVRYDEWLESARRLVAARLWPVAGLLAAAIVLGVAISSPPASAQTAEELAGQRGRAAMEQALQTKQGYDVRLGAEAENAKRLLKAMSDYLAAQQAISFDYDATLEVVTKEGQKLALASSGSAVLDRPDKIRATRSGGHADV